MKLKSVNKKNRELASLIDKKTFKAMVNDAIDNKVLKSIMYRYISRKNEGKDKHIVYKIGDFKARVNYINDNAIEIAEELAKLDCVELIREYQNLFSGYEFAGELYHSPLTLVIVNCDEDCILPYNVQEWYNQNKEKFVKTLKLLIMRKNTVVTVNEGSSISDLKGYVYKHFGSFFNLVCGAFLKRKGVKTYDNENYEKAIKEFSEYTARRFEDKIKEINPNLKKFTYKSMVKDYFGLDLKEGDNAPKLAKQLKKAGISYTDEEIRHFGEVQKWWNNWYNANDYSTIKENNFRCRDLWIDTKDFEIPLIVDDWAFNGSCNKVNSSAGADTHLILKHLGFNFLKGYSTYAVNGGYYLKPSMRTYYYKYGNDLGHAGTYADFEGTRAKACYEFTTVLLCIMFGKKVNDFSQVGGMPIPCDTVNKEGIDGYFSFWANQAENDYSKFGTIKDIFSEIDTSLFYEYIENELPLRFVLDNINSELKAMIKYKMGSYSGYELKKEKFSSNLAKKLKNAIKGE